MQDARGRRIVWRLMEAAHLFRESGSNEPMDLAVEKGERRQGLSLLNEVLRICPEHWLTMVKDQRLSE